ncbi:UNVERIFIED_CONTAM: B3 domain-containing protein [Sesamum latifolium]|uniref:B3 domain-containing protein n=1 Tax=Sesamum latifolium TaxID=2727402 RepID=A0AAW2Y5H2_9LAMI
MASSSFPSSSTHLSAKSHVAVAESEPQYYNFILASTDEEAITPITPLAHEHDDNCKRKVNEFFDAFASEGKPADEIAPTGAGVSTHLSPSTIKTKDAVGPTRNMALSSSTLSDRGKGKMPELFDAFASAGKPADETAPTEAGVSIDLSLDFAWPPTIKTKKEVGPSSNMALSSFPPSTHLSDAAAKSHVAAADTEPHVPTEGAISPITPLAHDNKGKRKVHESSGAFASEGKPADEIAPTEAGFSTDLSLHFPGPPKKTAVVNPGYHRTRDVVVPANLPDDGWKIKKVLMKSDVDGGGGGPGSVEVGVRDVDMGSEHVLVLKKWKGESSVLVKNWRSDFVKRRKLEEKDEIGLRWDDQNSKLEFTVLRKN